MSGLACTKKETVVEDASELNLGKEFEDAACLSLAEVRLIQQSKMDDDRENGDETNTTQTRVFEKTLAYVQRFAGGLNATSASLIRQTCQERGLLEFETAAVTNLQPMNYDEAKTLIPSIEVEQRFTEEQVEELLAELQNVRQFEA